MSRVGTEFTLSENRAETKFENSGISVVTYERSVGCSVLIYARYIARAIRKIYPHARITTAEIGESKPVEIKTPDDVTTLKLVRKAAEIIPNTDVSVRVRIGWISGFNVDIRHSKSSATAYIVDLFPASLFADVWAIGTLCIAALAFIVQIILSFEWSDLLPGPARAIQHIPGAVFWAVVYIVALVLVSLAGDYIRAFLSKFGQIHFDDKRLREIADLLEKHTEENPPRFDDPEINPVEAIRSALRHLKTPGQK